MKNRIAEIEAAIDNPACKRYAYFRIDINAIRAKYRGCVSLVIPDSAESALVMTNPRIWSNVDGVPQDAYLTVLLDHRDSVCAIIGTHPTLDGAKALAGYGLPVAGIRRSENADLTVNLHIGTGPDDSILHVELPAGLVQRKIEDWYAEQIAKA